MSLINDALKRATQNPISSATTPVAAANAPMQPVEYRRGGLPWFFFPSLLLILAGACWFIVKGIDANRSALPVHAREPQPSAPAADPNEPAAEMLAAGITAAPPDSPAGTAQPRRNFSLDDAPAAAAPETPAPAPATEPAKPAFKLQGIFFRTGNPSATVNGKNVTVGSRINGATVTSITREGVTLEADGQSTVLTLE